ncbi:hypothetical protein EVAR_41354_1 [Eumeta japonica]|uniref:Uncharacterized protein n=1 Tax=Eumeta variegata TaxID=151549 RepID=A0A4C1XRX8_EUMVA|nr:hypothetical protein EVAR_41354_1 [Eumeta japonica]
MIQLKEYRSREVRCVYAAEKQYNLSLVHTGPIKAIHRRPIGCRSPRQIDLNWIMTATGRRDHSGRMIMSDEIENGPVHSLKSDGTASPSACSFAHGDGFRLL